MLDLRIVHRNYAKGYHLIATVVCQELISVPRFRFDEERSRNKLSIYNGLMVCTCCCFIEIDLFK